MFFSYRKYRYGEHYEYQRYKASSDGLMVSLRQITGAQNVGVMDVLRNLERFK
jgi:hypothetical protein